MLIDLGLDMDYRIHFRSGLWWSIGKPCEDASEVVWEQRFSQEVSICAAEHGDRCFLPVRPDYRLAVPRGRSSRCLSSRIFTLIFRQESLETRKHRRDWGRTVGKFLVRTVKGIFKKKRRRPEWIKEYDDEQGSSLLKHRHSSSASTVKENKREDRHYTPPQPPPGYREVFSRQSNINLVVYTFLALHSMACDQLLPIFMHNPPQNHGSTNIDVHLPFKFAGGFGLDVCSYSL